MIATCGKDATSAYMTKDPYSSSNTTRSSHSSNALSLLADYYIGDLNQTIGKIVNNATASNSNTSNSTTTQTPKVNPTTPTSNKVVAPAGSVTLNMTEIVKHNKSSDCWMLISGKVYNITSYFGSHPGGNSPMTATCGIDATVAYATKNAYASSAGGRSAHSSNALGLLTNYYIGDLNQTIGTQKITDTSAVVAPVGKGGDDDEWDD
jgi:cytochrome b involved in lipid metabolism